jgi:hypothetical protein
VTFCAHSMSLEVSKNFLRSMCIFPRSRAESRVVAVLCCEVVEPFFSSAAAPHIHPFVIPVGWYPAAAQNREVLTPSILVRPSRDAGRLIQGNAGGFRRSTGLFRLALRREGLFFQGRRADATVSPLVLLSLCYSIFAW